MLFLIVYLGVPALGRIGQPDLLAAVGGERSPTAWRPYLWPIKSIMVFGIFLMLLQAISELFKDILRIMGHDMGPKDIDEPPSTRKNERGLMSTKPSRS